MTTIQFVDESPAALNGSQGPFVMESPALKRTSGEAGLESGDSDSELDSSKGVVSLGSGGPRPGKKTKGRVKIKMEFIENKLRRYTTFSKRKTGIMKKAYELSTLTGTQVMLLVASETGHVYTFATRKLQPMITSESGKALIQTCLNSPDAPPAAAAQNLDQRMNPGGFEEPELSYGVSEDENSVKPSDSPSMAQLYSQQLDGSPSPGPMVPPPMGSLGRGPSPPPSSLGNGLGGVGGALNFMTPSPSNTPSPGNQNNAIGMMTKQEPLQQQQQQQQQQHGISNLGLSTATQLFLPNNAVTSSVGGSPVQQPQSQQTLYRLPTPQPGQIINLPAPPTQNNNNKDATPTSGSTTSAAAPFMYQTPQGLVYAPAPQGAAAVPGIPEGFLLNLPNNPLPAMDQAQGGTQQYITIPVPVSLAAGGAQMLQPVIAQAQQAAAAVSNQNLVQQQQQQQMQKPK